MPSSTERKESESVQTVFMLGNCPASDCVQALNHAGLRIAVLFFRSYRRLPSAALGHGS